MSWPGRIPAGQVIHEVGVTMDALPTICQAAGVALPTDRVFDGVDAMPLAVSQARSPHEAVFWASGGQLAVRRGKWKLVHNGFAADGSDAGRKPLQGDDAVWLSDLDDDPGEKRNLRHREPALADELLTLAQQWLERTHR
jgi:arylsulfatase A-like enzyme